MTDYTDLIAGLRNAGHDRPADAIESLQRENALLRGAAEAARLGREARAEGMALRMRDWGLSTLQQMQGEQDEIARKHAARAKRLEDAWNAAPEGEHIPFGPEIRVAADNTADGDVTPLANQPDGKPGFT